MLTSTEEILKEIEKRISEGSDNQVSKFFLNALSGTPFIGGGFSATSSLWSEKDQEAINQLVIDCLKLTNEHIEMLSNRLVRQSNHNETVAGYIKFNPNAVEIIESSGVSSITDKGVLDFSINHSDQLDQYTFNYYGNGPVSLLSADPHRSSLHIKFQEPCPDLVTLVFYKTSN